MLYLYRLVVIQSCPTSHSDSVAGFSFSFQLPFLIHICTTLLTQSVAHRLICVNISLHHPTLHYNTASLCYLHCFLSPTPRCYTSMCYNASLSVTHVSFFLNPMSLFKCVLRHHFTLLPTLPLFLTTSFVQPCISHPTATRMSRSPLTAARRYR